MKKIINAVLLLLKNTTYYTTAIIVALILLILIVSGSFYKAYDNYYLEYISVQTTWIELDESFNKSLNETILLFEQVKNSSNKNELSDKIFLLEKQILELEGLNTYSEKIANYQNLILVYNNILELSTLSDSNIDISILSNLIKEYDEKKVKYNASATKWNLDSSNFPLNWISDVASFHKWILLK